MLSLASRPSFLHLAAVLAALVAWTAWSPVAARTTVHDAQVVAAAELPPEAREVLQRIHSGGPFHYERDGVSFGNREHMLPARQRGYYREYTVRTPGERTRG